MNFIKIVSLSLGFAVSTALMCKIAWYNSFDNFWQDVDNLQILEVYNDFRTTGGDDTYHDTYPGLAPCIASHIASIESATRFYHRERDFMVQENQFSLFTYFVDASFFDVFQIKIITGDHPNIILANPGNIILTKETAQILFPDGNALGQEVRNATDVFTVRAICEDIPENNRIFTDRSQPLQVIRGSDLPLDLFGDDDYVTCFRTYKNTDLQKLNYEIKELLTPIYKDWVDESGLQISFRVSNIYEYSHRMIAPFKKIPGVVLFLIITGLNFALITISSLISRSKEVGVRKASGAETSGIFSLIIWETTIYVLLAALLAAALLWSFKPQLDVMFGKFENIFALENLWGVAVVMIALILIAGLLPAWIFARIPVTQVFQRFVSHNLYWKRILLFIQFMGSILCICYMFIVLKQYQTAVKSNYGYEPDKLIWFLPLSPNEIQLQTLIKELKSDSRVEAISFSRFPVWNNIERKSVLHEPDDAEPMFCSYLHTDSNFFKTFGIEILRGNNNLTATPETSGNIIVNQEFIDKFKVNGNPIGALFYSSEDRLPYTITGVCRNFQTLTEGVQPMVVIADQTNVRRYVLVRVNEVTTDVIQMIQEKIKQCYPNTIVAEVKTCSDAIYQYYYSQRLGGSMAIFVTICLLLITIMGITGYVNLEVKRRTKEIAIRKIHGSTAFAIIWRISRELLFIALLATPIALTLAYIIGKLTQQTYVVKTEMSWYLFVGAMFVVVLTIAVCAVLQTWRAANANPARAIKSE
jgi:putative ABC transport system permease protein